MSVCMSKDSMLKWIWKDEIMVEDFNVDTILNDIIKDMGGIPLTTVLPYLKEEYDETCDVYLEYNSQNTINIWEVYEGEYTLICRTERLYDEEKAKMIVELGNQYIKMED